MIAAVHVVNVNVVGVLPVRRPRTGEFKPTTSVLEMRISAGHHRFADYEPMPLAEIGTEAVFRFAAFASGTQFQRRLLASMSLFSAALRSVRW